MQYTIIARQPNIQTGETREATRTIEASDLEDAIRQAKELKREERMGTPKIEVLEETGRLAASLLYHGNGTMGIGRY